MATYAWPFDSNVTTDGSGNPVYDRAVSSDILSAILKRFFTDGVFLSSSDALQVTAGSGMTLSVAAGNAHIQGKCWGTDAAVSVTITTADSQPRYDRVVLRRDNNSGVRSIYPLVIKGTPATSPVAPAQTRTSLIYDITLAYVYVGANAASISSSWITDKRSTTECGVVISINADINNALASNQAVFETWLTSLQNTLSGDVAGNLLALINQRVSYTGDDTATDSQRAQARKNTRTYMQTFTDASQIGITLSTSTTLEQIAAAMPNGSMLTISPSASATTNISPSGVRYGTLVVTRLTDSRIGVTWYDKSSSAQWTNAVTTTDGGSTWTVFGWRRMVRAPQSGTETLTIAIGATSTTRAITFSPAFSTAPKVRLTLISTAPNAYTGVYYSVQSAPTVNGFTLVVALGTAPSGSAASIAVMWEAEEDI